MKDAADVLAESREYLEKYGWCRGEMRNRLGNVCAMGAIAYSQEWANMMLDPEQQRVYQRVCDALYKEIKKVTEVSGMSVPMWNDGIVRTQQEVLDVFMAAEKQLRSGNVEES